ncbi:hypothetical protein RB195_025798 [Necator americanus]|uniref:Protein sleepless n=1 Tax=Necator americanus TaxID=51031 RepID=A0ABR1EU27_NECAM
MNPLTLVTLLIGWKTIFALKCHQCNGWLGSYPLRFTQASTCENRNNQCETNQYCVRILDTMTPGVEYVTFKSDCFYQTTLQVNPTNLSYVQGRTCFPFQDGSAPVKRWFYCFCNDRDYCNSSGTMTILLIPVISLLKYFWI